MMTRRLVNRSNVALLFQQFRNGDHQKADELAAQLLEYATKVLAHTNWPSDPATILDAVVEAVMEIIQHPDRFDPARSSLTTHVVRVAHRNLIDILRKQKRRQSVERMAASEWQRTRTSLTIQEHWDIDQRIDLLTSILRKEEAELLMARLDGKKSTAELAKVLNLGHLPAPEQQREVKRMEDRVRMRLKRELRLGRFEMDPSGKRCCRGHRLRNE